MKSKISTLDFSFKQSGYGHFEVTYTSPVTDKKFVCVTNDTSLVDAIRSADSPKVKDLNRLKKLCKGTFKLSWHKVYTS